jgi:hypothetical protein
MYMAALVVDFCYSNAAPEIPKDRGSIQNVRLEEATPIDSKIDLSTIVQVAGGYHLYARTQYQTVNTCPMYWYAC